MIEQHDIYDMTWRYPNQRENWRAVDGAILAITSAWTAVGGTSFPAPAPR